jgi:hypothetical protein
MSNCRANCRPPAFALLHVPGRLHVGETSLRFARDPETNGETDALGAWRPTAELDLAKRGRQLAHGGVTIQKRHIDHSAVAVEQRVELSLTAWSAGGLDPRDALAHYVL